MSYFDHQGHLTDEGLSLCADALKLGRPDQLPEELRGHLDTCASCQEEAMALYALIAEEDYSGLGQHPALEPAEGTAPASALKMWFRPLLLLLMAVLAFVLFLQQQRQRQQPPEMEEHTPAAVPPGQADSLEVTAPLSPPQAKVESKPEKPGLSPVPDTTRAGENFTRRSDSKDGQKSKIENRKSQILPGSTETGTNPLLAANFNPSETLEPLVGAVTRSEGLSGIRPANGAALEIRQTVVFSWQTSAEEPLTLRLLNNREEEVFSRSVEGGRIESPVALEPGLYYWKLETEDDLIYVGKFFIGKQRQD